MDNKQEWIDWIDSQIVDMYNNEEYTDESINRVFKTSSDDRIIAVQMLTKFKELLQENINN